MAPKPHSTGAHRLRAPDRRRAALIGCVLLAGCNDTRDLAPASSDTPWQIEVSKNVVPSTGAPSKDAALSRPAATRFAALPDRALPWSAEPSDIDPDHRYALAELIDLAERRNKTTRIAWEQARQAAIGVGLARAAYQPSLTASAIAGYQHVASPFPSNLASRGYITANANEIFPELAIRYLLLDFGSRDAAVRAARQLSFASNVEFTAAHQALILEVARAYFTLDGVDATLRAARQTLASSQLLQQSAEALYARGLGTVLNVALAQRGTAQARFDIAAATAAQHEAMYALLSAMDLPPQTRLRVEDSSERPLAAQTRVTIDAIMHDALERRPDLLADLARLRATEAGIAEARSEFYPKLSISANVQGNIGELSVDSRPYQNIEQPQAGVFLRFDWPLYQGGLLRNRLRLAQSREAEAEDALAEGSEQAMRQVALAYDQVETGLSRYDAAVALQAASRKAADAASEAYAHGVGTLTDAVDTLSASAAAQAAVSKGHAQSLIDAAALAFATGALTSSAAPSLTEPPP